MTLHLFNPSHDDALADGTPYYCSSEAARTLESRLWAIPSLWADRGDVIVRPKGVSTDGAPFLISDVEWVDEYDLHKVNPEKVEVWGWDAQVVFRLQRAGISPTLLPDSTTLDRIRQLSSRRLAVELLGRIRQDLPQTIGTSLWCESDESVWQIVEKYQTVVAKAPWSTSGRGIFLLEPNASHSPRGRVSRIIRKQGGIEVEPYYNRVADFALEFYADTCGVQYQGISLFLTHSGGAYAGNLIAHPDRLLQCFPDDLRHLLEDLIHVLPLRLYELLRSGYVGPLGVDMMLVQTEEGLKIHPCVEVNLRRTMGHVALDLCQKTTTENWQIFSPNFPGSEGVLYSLRTEERNPWIREARCGV